MSKKKVTNLELPKGAICIGTYTPKNDNGVIRFMSETTTDLDTGLEPALSLFPNVHRVYTNSKNEVVRTPLIRKPTGPDGEVQKARDLIGAIEGGYDKETTLYILPRGIHMRQGPANRDILFFIDIDVFRAGQLKNNETGKWEGALIKAFTLRDARLVKTTQTRLYEGSNYDKDSRKDTPGYRWSFSIRTKIEMMIDDVLAEEEAHEEKR